MPRIFDNIEHELVDALRETIVLSHRADFCVGYFNLRGWKRLQNQVDNFTGDGDQCCRLLLGMQRHPQEDVSTEFGFADQEIVDNAFAIRQKMHYANDLKEQLTLGAPTNQDEQGLRKLAAQISQGKLRVKLYLRHPLHAKLYLLFRSDPINPIIGYLGSSNLTLAGLAKQGELNIDVLDHDAAQKLATWFEDRWNDRFCVDISDQLVEIINSSWARGEALPPFYIYAKIAYHLSQEARAGLSEFRIPKDFGNTLFEFQTAAVRIAAHHLNKRRGVLLGDVVGLGKTLMATALARIFEDDYDIETLIISPKNLVRMWEDYRDQYRLRAKVISISRALNELPELRRYRLVIIDESHNLRNREGKRYRTIQEYLRINDSMCILLSATPYNKSYIDLSSQLRLFIPDDKDLAVRPEQLIRDIGEAEFLRRYQCSMRSLPAFEKSEYADDWRELMRLYLVRRTRTFIINNYAQKDEANGRPYLTFADGTKSYFPTRVPKTVPFTIDENDRHDQYAQLYADDVVATINSLTLPRYGLGNYIKPTPHEAPTSQQQAILANLSRAGKRLMGFSRTNLFKRLESSGWSFLLSIERHILRNHIFLYAIENGLPLPIGPQDATFLDTRCTDLDDDGTSADMFGDDDENGEGDDAVLPGNSGFATESDFKTRAEAVYQTYSTHFKRRFKWLAPHFFTCDLEKDLASDASALQEIQRNSGAWNPDKDAKLNALKDLISKKHPKDKVILFSQFADTVDYLTRQLEASGIKKLDGVTGSSDDPTLKAWQFSPVSNGKREKIAPADELRVLLATDVLSEGQNLQDCSIVVNFDLPWAIIRLVQRAGRVDRIGQMAEKILCYSFMPAEGVERLIRLRSRVRDRLRENAEVVGADEAFFEDEADNQVLLDLYHEKADLGHDDDNEVDLASQALEIWKRAVKQHPDLATIIPELPPVVYSTKAHSATDEKPEGALVYVKTSEDNDDLVWIRRDGTVVTQSQSEILRVAECAFDDPALERLQEHHDIVRTAAEYVMKDERLIGGQLGRPSGPRYRTYERLKAYVDKVKGTLFDTQELRDVVSLVYQFPLTEYAADALKRQLRLGITDESLFELARSLREDGRLCITSELDQTKEPRIICSLGLRDPNRN